MCSLQCSVDYTSPMLEQDLVIEDLGFLEKSVNKNTNNTKKRQRRSSINDNLENKDEETKDCKTRKVMHRDVERQRRREMATHYASLRSLIPGQFIIGKRSISDHMHQAVNYIKHTERKLIELKKKRDELINKIPYPNTSHVISCRSKCVKVGSLCGNGVEILITIGLKEEEGFFLSRVLKLLIETGLNVISCVSTKANGTFLYRIQSHQDNCLSQIDLLRLEQRLTNVIINSC